MDPPERRHVAGWDHPALVGHHPSVGESTRVEQAGKNLAPQRSFIPPEDSGVLDGFQKRIVEYHSLTIRSGARSAPITRRVDDQLKKALS